MWRRVCVNSLKSQRSSARCIATFVDVLRKPSNRSFPVVLRSISSNDPVPTSRKKKTALFVFDFQTEALRMIEKVYEAVSPLKLQNKDFELSYTSDNCGLVISTPRGKYTLSIDKERQILVLQSYFSGFHKYFYAAEEGCWLSVKDGHDLRGLLTRDLLRHYNGVPAFE